MNDFSKLTMVAPAQATTFKQHFEKVGLIDADFIKYLVVEDILKFIKENGFHPKQKIGASYLDVFTEKRMKKHFYDRFSAWGCIYCFSGASSNTFRSKLAITKKYKGNRSISDEKYDGYYVDLANVLSVVEKRNVVYVHEEYEADDLVSLLQNEYTFIFSRDKDLKQVEKLHYNESTGLLDYISEAESVKSVAMQLLIGDSADNISGIPGVGKKIGKDILENIPAKDQLNKVVEEYCSRFGTVEGLDRFAESWFLVKMRFVRIGKKESYESQKLKEVFEIRDTLIHNKIYK